MKAFLAAALLTAGLALGTAPAAATVVFQAIMTHDQEVVAPPGTPIPDEGSSGLATFVLDDAQTRLTYDVRLTGLDLGRVNSNGSISSNPSGATDDDVLRMHIHRALAGANGTIVFGIIDLAESLRNDNAPNDLSIDGPNLRLRGAWDLNEGNAGALGGAANLGTELQRLLAGGLYINVHTADHGAGEIRGQILRVPEPGSLPLLALGLLAIGAPVLRRR